MNLKKVYGILNSLKIGLILTKKYILRTLNCLHLVWPDFPLKSNNLSLHFIIIIIFVIKIYIFTALWHIMIIS